VPGTDALRLVHDDLSVLLTHYQRRHQLPSYAQGQLVAIYIDKTNEEGRVSRVWYRGVALRDVAIEIAPGASTSPPQVSVLLIDYGREETVPYQHVVGLPKQFSTVPALVSTLSLYI